MSGFVLAMLVLFVIMFVVSRFVRWTLELGGVPARRFVHNAERALWFLERPGSSPLLRADLKPRLMNALDLYLEAHRSKVADEERVVEAYVLLQNVIYELPPEAGCF